MAVEQYLTIDFAHRQWNFFAILEITETVNPLPNHGSGLQRLVPPLSKHTSKSNSVCLRTRLNDYDSKSLVANFSSNKYSEVVQNILIFN